MRGQGAGQPSGFLRDAPEVLSDCCSSHDSWLSAQIPSYFALILRAFSVIEGIALRVDPGYSIVQECFPYIARRLLTDNHPRTRAALQQLLYAVRLLSFRLYRHRNLGILA